MTPDVTEPLNSRPKGLPIAMAGSPTCTESESPILIGLISLGGLILTTAKSVCESVPITVPVTVEPSDSDTVTSPFLAARYNVIIRYNMPFVIYEHTRPNTFLQHR